LLIFLKNWVPVHFTLSLCARSLVLAHVVGAQPEKKAIFVHRRRFSQFFDVLEEAERASS
jgi:hypothetical protein